MLSDDWNIALRTGSNEKFILVTVYLKNDSTKFIHPYLLSGSIRFATNSEVILGGKVFWPLVAKWPTVRYSYTPEDRRAEFVNASVEILRNDALESMRNTFGSRGGLLASIDLYTKGVASPITLVRGAVVLSSVDEATGLIRLDIQDGIPDRKTKLPEAGEFISVSDFAEIPGTINNLVPKQIIIGNFPFPVPIYPISSDGKEFYLAHHALRKAPSEFFVGGDLIKNNMPTVVTAPLPSNPLRSFTKVVFRQPVAEAGLIGAISAGGGFGADLDVVDILETVGEYELTDRARSRLNTLEFNLSFVFSSSSDLFSIIFSRLLPQTPFVPIFRGGKLDLIEILSDTGAISLTRGSGLICRLDGDIKETPIDKVFNVIEVEFSRTPPNVDVTSLSTFSTSSVIVDRTSGGAIGELLTRSEEKFGRRYQRVKANDINSDDGAYILARLFAKDNAMIHNQYRYCVDWQTGLSLDLNSRVSLTDADAGLLNTTTRVIKKDILPYGPVLTFQTEDI